MLLHNDPELFAEVVHSTAETLRLPVPVVEKDYYVTMILKLLAASAQECVFKGGTSLSKCHHVIDRFSEDIDISCSEKLTQGQRKALKDEIIAGISKQLQLPITDWDAAGSNRIYNCYTFAYTPLEGFVPESLISGVKMEVSLSSLSFPTVMLPVDSYVYQFLRQDNMDVVEAYDLQPFSMRVQSLERTFIDKVFALCDYYLQGNTNRTSRHLYDLHRMYPHIKMNDAYRALIQEIRCIRADTASGVSAKPGVDVPMLLRQIIDRAVYREDYEVVTIYFQKHPVPYADVIATLEKIISDGLFA